ncbi:MAG: DUF72 domain-containing protein [Thermoplasmata archaeon]|nr:DUF72 domain-containing protein [Thermoplasmata archaeon]
MGAILLGTSGWDYPEWVGPVYPAHRNIDRLRHYADLFPIVEVNSTFYHLPTVSVVGSWVRRTPSGFRFAVKFPQTITHERRLVGADGELREFLRVVRPLTEAGRLVGALLQLPPSLAFDAAIVRSFYESIPAELPVAVEFRQASWTSPESLELLKEFRLAYSVVDEPLLPISLHVTGSFSYVRWHGHGTPLWYDYTYSPAELARWIPRIRQLAEDGRPVYGFFNNHFRGDAAVNCRQFTELLELPRPSWMSPRLD